MHLPWGSITDLKSILLFLFVGFFEYWKQQQLQLLLKKRKKERKTGSWTWAHGTWQPPRRLLTSLSFYRPELSAVLLSFAHSTAERSWCSKKPRSFPRTEWKKQSKPGRKKNIPNFHISPPLTLVTLGWESIGHQHTVCSYTKIYNNNLLSCLVSLDFL